MPLLGEDEVEARLGELEGWRRDGDTIVKEFKLEDFVGSVDFINRLLPVAEEMNHHPDLQVSWNTVAVSITTHSEGGLTENDFELAKSIDPLV